MATTLDRPAPSTFDWSPPGHVNDPVASRIWFNIERRWQSHFFKTNSTLNALAALTADEIELDSTELTQFTAEEQRLRDRWNRRVGPPEMLLWENPAKWAWERARSAPLTFTYNPEGQQVIANLAGSLFQFDSFLLDVAAVQRLARLGEAIRRERIPATSVPEFMNRHPSWSRHPLSNQPFAWRAADNTITVPTVRDYPTPKRFWIRVWQPGAKAN